MIAPLYVANNMIRRAKEHKVSLTNLKLQKLLYLLYTKYYHESGYSLFPDRFEAWKYGPVLTKIYEVFKDEGSNPLVRLRPDPNGKVYIVSETDVFGDCIDHIWAIYARKSASELVAMTHGPDTAEKPTAWRKAVGRGGLGEFLIDADIKEDGEAWFGA